MKTTGSKFADVSLDESRRDDELRHESQHYDSQRQESHEQGGLLSSWSKRKQAVLREQETFNKTLNKEGIKDDLDETVEPVLLTDDDMPPIESLNADSDYSGFMSPKVSETLRRLALRKLFHGAEFNICDGLDDYDGDYTSFAKLGDIVTADMKHQIEMQARKKARLLEEQEAQKSLEQEDLEQKDLEQKNLEQKSLEQEASTQDDVSQGISSEVSADTKMARDESMQQQDRNDVDLELIAEQMGNTPGNTQGMQSKDEPVDELSVQMKTPALAVGNIKVVAAENVTAVAAEKTIKGINDELEEDEYDEDDQDGGMPG